MSGQNLSFPPVTERTHKVNAALPSVCVFCGSRVGADPEYRRAASDLGHMLAANKWRLVYGAGDIGLMGEVARAAQSTGGGTFGVIPRHLLDREVGRRALDTLVVTETMHERKKVMFMNADAIVVLPGGAGSLDEFFEVLTWRQLGLHAMPIVLANIGGYWDPLVDLLEHVIGQGFADASLMGFVTVAADMAAVEATLRAALS
jgi:uncharacterized protein (TIGR00730 family)